MIDVLFLEIVELARCAASLLAVAMLDLGFFKEVNDTS
jgi:GGDEF domain-containing protein